MTIDSGPAQETLRLAKLQDYGILDTLPEAAYDDIVKLAAYICQAPTALVSLIDADRQWFKAKVGLDGSESPRDIAFCNHTIQQSEPMIVEDTYQSPRFRNNPMVTGPPYIRFYAGTPLVTPEGYAVGSLCVIDYQPRQLTHYQLQALKTLSRQVIAQMELGHYAHQLHSSNKRLEKRVQERTAKLSTALQRLLQTQSKLLKREATSRHSALHDPLTGLPNRSYFLQRLDQAIQLSCRQPSHLYAVLFLDLDHFKPVNDALGHTVGDRLLQHIADQIKLLLRKSDLVARLGGDEFAILLDDIPDEQHALIAVKRLQQQLNTPFVVDDHTLSIGASIGITFSTLGYRHPEAALKDADTAMYQAKKQAKAQAQERLQQQLEQQTQMSSKATSSPILIPNELSLVSQNFLVFDADMQGREQARVTLEEELRQAALGQQFHLYYQPIFELHRQQLSGFEVLLRWHHPTRGCLDASEFIAIAEEIGIVRQLCTQVIQSACEQLSSWRQAIAASPGPKKSVLNQQSLSLHINLSLLQLSYPLLIPTWKSNLEKFQLPATAFTLEIDEKVLISNNPSITSVLHQLKTMGFGLCVDDFGRGHSSLSRLHQLAISTLKIDRAFVKELTPDGNSSSIDIIKTILDLGRSAEIAVIAEGIETIAQLETLMQLGCQLGQGFWLSKALHAKDIEQMF
ncbi:MAG: EAL domain-containing protein [Cyanobacteria bacterium J06560_5]